MFARNGGVAEVPKYTSYDAAPAAVFQDNAGDRLAPVAPFAGAVRTGATRVVPLVVKDQVADGADPATPFATTAQ